MDKISINQNVILELSNGKDDLTLIPLEINWDFLALQREGFKMHYGPTTTGKFEYLNSEVTFRECQHIPKEF